MCAKTAMLRAAILSLSSKNSEEGVKTSPAGREYMHSEVF